MKSLFKKINQVMKDVEYLQKDDTVGYGSSKYKAISEEKVTLAVRKSMIEHGLVIIPTDIQKESSISNWEDQGKRKQQVFTEVIVSYTIACTESGEQFQLQSAGHGVDSQDKSIGKAITYAYKYLLLRTFAIPTGDDPDKIHSESIEVSPEPSDKVKNIIQAAFDKCKTLQDITSTWNSNPQYHNQEWFKSMASKTRGRLGV